MPSFKLSIAQCILLLILWFSTFSSCPSSRASYISPPPRNNNCEINWLQIISLRSFSELHVIVGNWTYATWILVKHLNHYTMMVFKNQFPKGKWWAYWNDFPYTAVHEILEGNNHTASIRLTCCQHYVSSELWMKITICHSFPVNCMTTL